MSEQVRTDTELRFVSRVPRARIRPPVDLFPVDPWLLGGTRFSPDFLPQVETMLSLSNGYLGLRGDVEEGAPVSSPGVFLNGFYEAWDIPYGESAYGFAKTGQTIVNATDGKIIRLYVDDEPFEIERANLLEWRRALDMKRGWADREVVWETPAGKQIAIRSRRMVSIVHRHLALLTYDVRCLNHTAHITLSSEMMTRRLGQDKGSDPRTTAGFDGRVLDPVVQRVRDRRLLLCHRTRRSGLTLACAMDHVLETDAPVQESHRCSENRGEVVFSIDVDANQPVHLAKLLAYHWSGECDVEELCARAERTLDRNLEIGEQRLFEEQEERLADFWSRSDVEIEGDPAIQQEVRFSLFQVFQASARAEGAGVPAKGLTGQGYEGHYFWDGEIYVLPYLIYTQPRVARNLLRFRYDMLDQARAHARELHHEGAMFPWRTVNGEEASAYYAAGTAQYHINADIMYAVRKYALATRDADFLRRWGVEMLVETARFWTDLGYFSPRRGGAFCINNVTGPDEYSAVVDNNRFTNLMARENLRAAIRGVEFLRDEYPADMEHVIHATSFEYGELDEWRRAADLMYLALDEETGIYPQDDTFLDKKVWDCAGTPPEDHPLLLHYHPLTIYRHQVIKQADVVMAMFLLGQDFSEEEKRRNFDYYDPLTTRDSSLSSCIQSIVASEIGYSEKAMEYFMEAALVDLADIGGNVSDGVHIASAGGVWMSLVQGFGGMRDYDGALSFRPRLPTCWTRLHFPITFLGRNLDVDIRHDRVVYTLLEGEELRLRHEGELIELTPASPVAERPGAGARDRGAPTL